MPNQLDKFWSLDDYTLLSLLNTPKAGLTDQTAKRRQLENKDLMIKSRDQLSPLKLWLSQFKSPIILILIFAAALSFYLQDQTDSIIITLIIFISGSLGFWQEYQASSAVSKLLSLVETKVNVLRDGTSKEIPIDEIVPGDIINLNGGDIIPGDCLILSSRDLFIDEATLTGESYPVEKYPGEIKADTPLSKRTNSLFLGTHVVSGTAQALVVKIGKSTELGQISQKLQNQFPETEFENGIRKFGYFLMVVTLFLVAGIFAINVYLQKNVLESLIFALALAVGLTPQLLPAIISINLSHGAKKMAEKKVILKRLPAIENFGSMNILCSDKTGTLTEGAAKIKACVGIDNKNSDKTLFYAYLNASFETSFNNPIDQTIRSSRHFSLVNYQKLDEIPYDFSRKRLSVVVKTSGKHILITKGSFTHVLNICSLVEDKGGKIKKISQFKTQLDQIYQKYSSQGFRILGVAYKNLKDQRLISKGDEKDLIFLGFIVLYDPPKEEIAETIKQLNQLGISLRIISGDSKATSEHLSKLIGFNSPQILTGTELSQITDEALAARIKDVEIFAEVEPNQKERIILALKRAGNVVGFLGDGINDAPALIASDVGISVNSGVDVAKEAASIVLLKKDLNVLKDGVLEGRRTFANTIKYIFMATSANFGNMFSMAGASLFLSFLPLLPKQILLVNLLTDLPEMAIATDNIDEEWIKLPHKWDINFIKKFMLIFGPLSSIFDYLTFGLLLTIGAGVAEFRTGWFLESTVSAALVVLVIRTRHTSTRNLPSKYLFFMTILVLLLAHLLPFTPLAEVFGFTQLPLIILMPMELIIVLYVLIAELSKHFFYHTMVKDSLKA